jgi:hypothetical protein
LAISVWASWKNLLRRPVIWASISATWRSRRSTSALLTSPAASSFLFMASSSLSTERTFCWAAMSSVKAVRRRLNRFFWFSISSG